MMNILRRNRRPLSLMMAALMMHWQIGQPLRAATINWTGSSDLLWNTGGNWSAGVPTAADDAVFVTPIPTVGPITLGAGSLANSLLFKNNYCLTGGDLTLTAGSMGADYGMTGIIESQLVGTTGLTKTGGGSLKLTNALNAYTGTTTISNGSIVINNAAALGADTSTIMVTGSASRGFGGGTLVLEGNQGTGVTLTRGLSLQGLGPITDRSVALFSVQNNTITGPVLTNIGLVATNIHSAGGRLTFAGGLDVAGTTGTTYMTLGGVNSAGVGSYEVTGPLTGTGSIQKASSGTLILNPSDSSGFSGTLRISAGSVRVSSPTALGTNAGTTTSGTLDMNGGALEVLSDANFTTTKNIYHRAGTGTIFVDHAPGSAVINSTATFGAMAFEESLTMNFNGRNGDNITIGATPVQGGTGSSTLANNLNSGLLTFNGTFWSNADATGSRTMTIGGNGNTLISGNVTASSTTAAIDHSLTKTGTGTLTISSVAGTLDGALNVNGGTVAIADFRSINNSSTNTGTAANFAVNIGTTTTAGTLTIGVAGVTPTAAGLSTLRNINLAGTTGAATINASQPGTNPVIIANIGTTGVGAKTLTLGGTNGADNAINGVIADNGVVSLVKADSGTWVLGGNNTFTGGTTITGGTLKLKASAAASNIINSTAAVTFGANATTQAAGGQLEFVGQAGTANAESLGALTPTAGMNTIKLTPGASGGTASLTFTSLGTVNAASGVNIVSPASTSNVTITGQVTSTATTLPGTGKIYINGADFARANGTLMVTPVYGTDAGFVNAGATLTSANHNRLASDIASQAAITVSSLKIDGTRSLGLSGLLTVSTGGLLQTGGTGTISGTGITTAGANSLAARVNLGTDVLNLSAPITNTTTGGLTKNGAGMLVLSGANAQTGTTTINEGTIKLSGSGTLSGAGQDLVIRQAGTLDLNGVSTGVTIKNLIGAGTVTNSNAAAATLTVGNGTPAASIFSGVIQNGTGGAVSVAKRGTVAFTFSGLNTYTGSTTIESTGSLTVNTLADIGVASGIGAGLNTSDSTNAASLVFQGPGTSPTPSLIYTGTTSASTNRLFTLDMATAGSIAQIVNNSGTNAAIVFSKTSPIAFGTNATTAQTLSLGGTSTADNFFNPQISDNGALPTTVIKAGAGNWTLGNNANTYTGVTRVDAGTLVATDGTSLPAASNLTLNGGTFESGGSFTRAVGTAAGNVQWTANAAGGFSGGASKLTVNLPGTLVWGSTPGFLGTGGLVLSSTTSLSEVEMANGFELTQGTAATGLAATTTAAGTTVTLTSGSTAGLTVGQVLSGNANIPAGATIASITGPTTFTLSSGTGVLAGTSVATDVAAGGVRQITVNDNTNTQTDFATISGAITGNGTLSKLGTGTLQLFGANTYTGQTAVTAGTLVVKSLGLSTGPAVGTSVGASTGANTAAQALTLGNGGTGAAILQYIGPGEVSDRMIRLNTTTGSNQIHADGSGPLVLTNVVNDMAAGAKVLVLRGSNTAGNMITSVLADNTGALGVTVDGGATWILNAANTYSGTTSAGAGALGIGNDAALGTGTLSLSNSSIFAYGGDRTVANAITHANNTTEAFIGDYSLNFTGTYTNGAGANNIAITNSIVPGKTLTIGNMPNTAMTAARTLTVNGPGTTIFNGNVTTSTAFNLNLTYSGTGSLQLNGTGNNWNGGTVTLSSGKLILGADEVIPDLTGAATNTGNVVINPAVGVTATLDLNGHFETINGLTGTSAGTMVINNGSATNAGLIVGANDQTVQFNGSITRTGTGGITLGKAGAGTATFAGPADVTSLIVQGGALKLTGGLTSPSAITGVQVDGGALLNLYDGVGTPLNNLTLLSLGSGSGTATLELEAGTTTDTLTTINAATVANNILLNIRDAGLNPGGTYPLLVAPSGLSGGTYALGPIGGYTGSTLTVTDTLVQLNLGTAVTGNMFWTGIGTAPLAWNSVDGSSNGDNWSSTKDGLTLSTTVPGAGTTVVFQANNATGSPLNTTLEQSFRVNNLVVETATVTPSAITIAPGAVTTNRLTIQPTSATDGIQIKTLATPSTTISAQVGVGANQTWEVNDAVALTGGTTVAGTAVTVASTVGLRDGMPLTGLGIPAGAFVVPGSITPTGFTLSAAGTAATGQNYAAASTLVLSGGLTGSGNITKTGTGKVVLSGAGTTYTGTSFTLSGGTLEMQNATALGGVVATPNSGAAISVGAGTLLTYNSATAATIPNSLTLNGGTLAVGSGNHTFSGTVNMAANSTVSLADLASTTHTSARTITLSGVLSGAGKMTVNSVPTITTGNPFSGNLVITQPNPAWTGGFQLNQGTVDLRTEQSLGTGAVSAAGGRFLFKGATNTTWNMFANGLTVDGPSGAAPLELQPDNQGTSGLYTTNISGPVTLGGSGATPSLRIYQADSFSNLTISGPVVMKANSTIHNSGATAGTQTNVVSGVISESGGSFGLGVNNDPTWASVNYQVLRLDGANTFTGPVTLAAGTLDYSTVTDAGGAASNLGQGSAFNINSATLRFVGTTSQSTNRPITLGGSPTFATNGSPGASITYSGAINGGGNSLTLTGASLANEGFITGGLTQTGTAADLNVNSGTWHLSGAPSVIADDVVVTGATAVLNLDSAGVLTAVAGTSNGLYSRTGAMINVNANDPYSTATGLDFILLGDNSVGVGTLNTNTFNITTPRLDLGQSAAGFVGSVIGNGTVTVGTNINLYQGTISAGLAGAGAIQKAFNNTTVTLSGDNSGLTGTTAARVDAGTLILDYTTNNATKLRAATGLDIRGGTLIVNGSNTAPTTQTVGGLTLASGGSSVISVNAGNGQTAVLDLGAITRAASAGTVRFTLPTGTQSATNGILTSTPLTNGIIGGYATVNDGTGVRLASKSGNNIVPLVATPKDDVSTWLATDNVTDAASFTNSTLGCASVNSITFANPGSTVNVSDTLMVGSGGLMVTSTSTGAGIQGGILTSGIGDIIVNQYASGDFQIGSSIRGANAVTKTGPGTLLLSGNNTFTGTVNIQEGVLKVSGGKAIGDTASVVLKDTAGVALQLLNSEAIGSLSGGGSTGGNINLGTNSLTINQSVAGTFTGLFTGSGSIIKQGTTNLQFDAASSTGFTGSLVINQGLVFLTGNGTANMPAITSITTAQGGAFLLDFNSGTTGSSRINDAAAFNLSSYGNGSFAGLQIRSNQDVSHSETFGVLNLLGSTGLVGLAQAGGTARTLTLTAASLARFNNSTVFLAGRNLAITTGDNRGRIFFTSAPALVGGAGVAGATATNVPIIRFAVTEANVNAFSVNDVPTTFANYNATTGVTPLNIATEYKLDSAGYAASADANDNLRFTTGATVLATKTFNAVVFDSSAAAMTVSGVGGATGNVLTVNSGAMLFTSSVPANGTTLDTFDAITPGAGSSNEFIITVANNTSTINSVLTNGAAATTLTKSGSGTLVLGGTNTYTGPTVFNQGTVRASSINNFGVGGALNFFGGTLQFGGVFDPSSRVVTINSLGGPATWDTNGFDIVLASAIGNSAAGALTKTGLGNLTFNAKATFTGGLTVTNGTVTAGIANFLPATSSVTVNGATAVFDLGTFNQAIGTLTLVNGSVNGTATLTATDYQLQGGTIASTVILGGTAGLTKTSTGTTTLSGLQTFSGQLAIQSGVVSFDSIANSNGTASALGAPATAANGIILMGQGTNANGLTYTGIGHSTNREIDLTGTTATTTISANGTGALDLAGGIESEELGVKTLVLRGTSTPLTVVNKVSAPISECYGSLNLQKLDANTWELDAANTYTGATQVDEGTLRIGISNALPVTTATRLGNGTTAGSLDLNGFNQTLGSLTSSTNSTTATNTLLIPAASTLTVNGAVTLGANAAASTTLITATGGGSFVNNNIGGTFQVGGATGATNVNTTTADFSGLSSFTANLGPTGTFRVGDNNTNSSGSPVGNSTVILASTSNTITAGTISLGQGTGQGSSVQTLSLGAGTNVLNADVINIGGNTTRSGGAINFAGATGTLTVRAADGVSPAAINMVNGGISTGFNQTSDLLLAGHSVDVLASTVTMATRSANTGSVTANLTFDDGTFTATTLNIANRSGTGTATGSATGTVTFGDGAIAGTPTTTIGTVNMAVNTSAGGTVTADMNVTGGNVNLGSVNMTNATAGRTAIATLDLTGGVTTLGGNITRTGGAGTETASVTIAGGILDMASHSIGTAAAPITLVADSGTLKNLSQLNGGGTLTKTGTGTLKLEGTNTYTGDTNVTAGTVLADNTAGSATGTGSVTIAAGATLGGTGSVTPAADKNITINGTLSPGDPGAIAGSDLNLGVIGTGTLGLLGTLDFTLFSNPNNGALNPLNSSTLLGVSAPNWSNVAFGTGSTLKVNLGTGLTTAGWLANTAFKLFDWSAILGGTAPLVSSALPTLDLPTLDVGLSWNTSDIFTTGQISIQGVPEPSRVLLLLFGLAGLFIRRRRRE